MLSPPTCVGLRYGLQLDSLRGFSSRHGLNHFRYLISLPITSRAYRTPDLPKVHPARLDRPFHRPDGLPFRAPTSLKRHSGGI